MNEGRIERRLAAILSADVAGYSRLIGENEEGTLGALRTMRREVIDPAIGEHRGRIVKTTGDGLLAEFQSVVDAVRCATAWQAAVPTNSPIAWRIGIHQGDIVVEDGDIFGDGVNIAARLEGLADPGGICVSARVQEDVAGRLNFEFKDTGEQSLKNIARPMRVYRVRTEGMPVIPAIPQITLPDKPSIAVLPFQNMSGDPEQEYFADGMVEEIITALSRIRWLFVIARNSSFTYKGQAADVKRVGRELGVRYVLEGSVRKGGNRVRITAQLIEAETGTHLWADRFDGTLESVFDLQDQVASSVSGVIEPALAEAERGRVLRKQPDRLDAWEAYQRGLWHLYKYVAEEHKKAESFFLKAIEIDPNFSPGHYGYALAQFFKVWLYSNQLGTRPGTALEEAQLAVTLDDRDAMAHAVLSFMWLISGEWDAAIAEGQIAVNLNPNSPWSTGMLGTALGWRSHHREGIAYLRQTIRLSPHDPLIWAWTFWIGMFEMFQRDLEAALDTFRKVTRLRPSLPAPHFNVAGILVRLGRTDEARMAAKQAQHLFPDSLLANIGKRTPWQQPEDFAFIEEIRHLVASLLGSNKIDP